MGRQIKHIARITSPKHYEKRLVDLWLCILIIECTFCGKVQDITCKLRRGPHTRQLVHRGFCVCCGSNLNQTYNYNSNREED